MKTTFALRFAFVLGAMMCLLGTVALKDYAAYCWGAGAILAISSLLLAAFIPRHTHP